MKKYYHGHESVYKRLKKENKTSWNEREESTNKSFDSPELLDLLGMVLKDIDLTEKTPLKALDLGCGTGHVSHFLADAGFYTHGIDVSPTAIEMAKKIAEENNLGNSTFEVGDIVELQNPDQCYDLIVDAHCLHCIVFDDDRRKALSNINALLKPGGLFVVQTMTFMPEMIADLGIFHNRKFDEDFILWHKTGKELYGSSKEFDGEWYMPQRRIFPKDVVREELSAAKFSIKWGRLNIDIENKGSTFSALCIKN